MLRPSCAGAAMISRCPFRILSNGTRANRGSSAAAYLMFDFCVPSRGTKVPDRPDWIHEVKYDGYRLMVQRDGDRVRLITRNGYDWTKRYPWIVEAARRNKIKQFVIDGEAVILGVDGVSDFDALHVGRNSDEVQLYAFDVLAMDGDDLRGLPLSMRKTNLARLLRGRLDGMFLAPFEQGRSGPTCSARPASSRWRGWCRNGSTGVTVVLGRRTGSRPRIRRRRRWCARRISNGRTRGQDHRRTDA
jgi:bifunctional non-homologous end joining protein LigD